MNGADFAVAALAVALVTFTIVHNVRKRKKGEGACPYCEGCGKKGNCR
jgi:hypothetical protein